MIQLPRQPSKIIRLLAVVVTTLLIRLPWWFVYYSWPPNRPRKSWTLGRTIWVQLLRQTTNLPMKLGVVFDKRDLSLEVPQEKLESVNARFTWIPELEKDDIVGMVGEHAARAGVKSIVIPAYWIMKEGFEWSPTHEKALKDEKTMVYIHGGAFVVSFFSPTLCLRTNPLFFRVGLPTRLTQQRPFQKDRSNTLHPSPECCRSITDSLLAL
jgi:hypothetical protein